MTSAPRRRRRRPATVVLPDAVGPKSARTVLVRAGRLLEAVLDLIRRLRALERPVVLRVRGAPLLEPVDRTRDAFGERRLRLPCENVACLPDVGDVVRDLTEERRRDVDAGLDVEPLCDQLCGRDERVPLAVREVDRLVLGAA